MNKDLEILESLKTSEIIPILKSIRLGRDHLAAHLTPEQFSEMLEIAEPLETKTKSLSTTIQERIGNLLIVVNTIVTSCFGMTLGSLGLYDLKVNLGIIFLALSASISVGIWLGVLSIRHTRAQSQSALIDYKLFRLELYILRLIISKRENLISKLYLKINTVLDKYFSKIKPKPNYEHVDLEFLVHRLEEEFHDKAWNDKFYNDLRYVHKPNYKINVLLKQTKKLKRIISEEHLPDRIAGQLAEESYLQMFARINYKPKVLKINTKNWFSRNYVSVLIGLMPTLIGGFASMFVFLVGVPNMFRTVNLLMPVNHAYLHFVKNTGLVTAFLMTIYFGYSHVYSCYRNFIRETHKQECDNIIELKNDKIMRLSREISLLDRIFNLLDTILMLQKLPELVRAKDEESMHP